MKGHKKVVNAIYNKKESAMFEASFYENCVIRLTQGKGKNCLPYQWKLEIFMKSEDVKKYHLENQVKFREKCLIK